ncbi:hypothetical protein Ddye_006363 [Dipteronia dyeriana]|uniref:Uncharacterized protein n=1 Tax=Dipteronia dyeriana TaxID=168575 RepID=A0AAE0CQG5_9ROSI|nr:hypothetical protein Ddye_006363 [Dipteronia dyeriana]
MSVTYGNQVRVLLDTGAMHNSISLAEVKRLGLRVTKSECVDAKTANTLARQPNGTSKGVTVHLGRWSGNHNFSVLPIDDYTMVLAMTFFTQTNAFLLHAANSSNTCNKGKTLSIQAESLPDPCMIPSLTRLEETPSSPSSPQKVTPRDIRKSRKRASHER